MGGMATDFLVSQRNLRETLWRETPLTALLPGQARLTIGRFALTANNITYAAFGEAMHYWRYFPAPEGLGRIPVWGFAKVAESLAEGLRVGERIYGYLPMSTHLTVDVAQLDRQSFLDGAAHRAGLANVYNRYIRVANDAEYAPSMEARQSLLRPVFMTAFLIDDFLADNGFFGGREVLLSSASSKTALGLAFTLRRAARPGVAIIGLTSARNRGFVESTDYFDRVVTYEDISAMPVAPSVFVDMAGSVDVRAAVHRRFGEELKYSCSVGGTHWEEIGSGKGLPGPKPILFFAPAQLKKRIAEWGGNGIEGRFAPVWAGFINSTLLWLRIQEHRGRAGVEKAYFSVLEGQVRPDVGVMASVQT